PIKAAAHARRRVESRLQSHVQQILSGVPIVQAFAQEEREQLRFKEFTRAAIKAQQRSRALSSVYNLGSGLITVIGTAAILWLGAHHVLQGRLTIGSVLVFLSYVGLLQRQMKVFTGIHNTLQAAGGSVDRTVEVLDAESEVMDKPGAPVLPPIQGHISLENVTFGYELHRPVIRDVSLEVLTGQTVAIVGPTGAGKTTLVGLVPRFFDPSAGRVLIDGRDVRDVQMKSLRAQVALVLQEPFLFPISIADNIAYGRPDASHEEIEAAARAANAHDFITRLPDGYDTVIGERGGTLSGGEKQRLSIARALLKDAPVLILDEPTSALDAETEHLLLDALHRLMQGRTTLIIAHRLSTIIGADQIAVMKEGRLIERGTHAEMLGRGGFYSRLFRRHLRRQRSVVRQIPANGLARHAVTVRGGSQPHLVEIGQGEKNGR
ncbi:MAG: ABC transporter ATP-binding protein, partial [Chloroflexia bacterium]